MAVKIIYEDKDILVCEKPAGLAVQSARISEPDMVSELKNYLTGKQPTGAPGKSAEISAFGGTRQPASATTSVGVRKPQSVYLGVVHRLDQPVSGLLVFAKNKKAAGALSTQTAQHQMNKIYYAVVYTKEDLTGKRGTLTDVGKGSFYCSRLRCFAERCEKGGFILEMSGMSGKPGTFGSGAGNGKIPSDPGADGACGDAASWRSALRQRRESGGIHAARDSDNPSAGSKTCVLSSDKREKGML